MLQPDFSLNWLITKYIAGYKSGNVIVCLQRVNWIYELRMSESSCHGIFRLQRHSHQSSSLSLSLLSFPPVFRAAPHKPDIIAWPNSDSPSPQVFHFLPLSIPFPSTPSSPWIHTLPHIKSHNEARKMKLTKLFSEFLQSFPLRNTATRTDWQNGSAIWARIPS